MIISGIFVYGLILLASLIAIISQKIDVPGGIAGGATTCLLYATTNLFGVFMIGSFFVLGTLASLYRIRYKTNLNLAEARNSKRGWKNVLSNSGSAALFALIDVVFPELIQVEFIIASCFATALSDTFSSEMGNVTGRNYFSILTLRSGKRGVDGVVSWQGFGWGLVGSSIIGALYWVFFSLIVNAASILLIGFFGNVLDSVLGATLQKKKYLGNHGVNFVSTTAATGLALVYLLW